MHQNFVLAALCTSLLALLTSSRRGTWALRCCRALLRRGRPWRSPHPQRHRALRSWIFLLPEICLTINSHQILVASVKILEYFVLSSFDVKGRKIYDLLTNIIEHILAMICRAGLSRLLLQYLHVVPSLCLSHGSTELSPGHGASLLTDTLTHWHSWPDTGVTSQGRMLLEDETWDWTVFTLVLYLYRGYQKMSLPFVPWIQSIETRNSLIIYCNTRGLRCWTARMCLNFNFTMQRLAVPWKPKAMHRK